jgi:hypothetical protein
MNAWVLAGLLAFVCIALHGRYIEILTRRTWLEYWKDSSKSFSLSKAAFFGSLATCALVPFAPVVGIVLSMGLLLAHGLLAIRK